MLVDAADDGASLDHHAGYWCSRHRIALHAHHDQPISQRRIVSLVTALQAALLELTRVAPAMIRR
jgi:hypothetical protein